MTKSLSEEAESVECHPPKHCLLRIVMQVIGFRCVLGPFLHVLLVFVEVLCSSAIFFVGSSMPFVV